MENLDLLAYALLFGGLCFSLGWVMCKKKYEKTLKKLDDLADYLGKEED